MAVSQLVGNEPAALVGQASGQIGGFVQWAVLHGVRVLPRQ